MRSISPSSGVRTSFGTHQSWQGVLLGAGAWGPPHHQALFSFSVPQPHRTGLPLRPWRELISIKEYSVKWLWMS